MTDDLKPQLNYIPEDLEGGSLGSVDKLKPNTDPPEIGLNTTNIGGGADMVRKAIQSVNYSRGEKGAGYRIDPNGDAEFQNIKVNNVQAGGVIEITVETTDNLQTALDEINTQGGGTLRLSPGTYTVNNDLVVYDNTYIEGDSSGNTTINFASQAYGITFISDDDTVYTAGTIGVTQGTTTVTGTDTSWTSAMIGRQIFISNRWYVISAVGGAGSLTIATAFADTTIASGGSYRIADPINNVGIRNLTITGSTTNAIEALDIRDFTVYDVVCVANAVGISLTNFMNTLIDVTTCAANTSNGSSFTNGSFLNTSAFANVSNTGSGVVTNNIKACTFIWSAANANSGASTDGYNCTDTDSCQFKLELAGNGRHGINFVSGCDNNFLNDSLIAGNTSDGIKLTATSDANTIGSTVNLTNNGGYGINIAAATCDNNCIFGPWFGTGATANSSGAYTDSGTSTDIITRTTAAFGGTKQHIFTSDFTLSSSTTETTVFTTSVAANTLSTNNAIKGRLWVSNLQISNTYQITFRLKYGSTTLVSSVLTNGQSVGALNGGYVDFVISGAGSTSSQEGHIQAFFYNNAGQTIDVTPGGSQGFLFSSGTSSEDSTGALNLVMTAQFNNSSATDTITIPFGELSIIK